jgi:hypothetical protein
LSLSPVRELRWLDQYLRGVELRAIDRETMGRITKAGQAEGVANTTVNRVLEVMRAILRKAVHDWKWLGRMPRLRLLSEPTRRVRFLTRAEAEQLVAEPPKHLVPVVRFSLETGLRQANVTGLQFGKNPTHAFAHPNKPMRQVNTKAWRAALKRARHGRTSRSVRGSPCGFAVRGGSGVGHEFLRGHK